MRTRDVIGYLMMLWGGAYIFISLPKALEVFGSGNSAAITGLTITYVFAFVLIFGGNHFRLSGG